MESRTIGITSKGEVLFDSAEVDAAIKNHFSDLVLMKYKNKIDGSYKYENLAHAVYNEAVGTNWKINRYVNSEEDYKLEFLAKGMVLLAPYCSKDLSYFIKYVTHISKELKSQLLDAALKYNSKQTIVQITSEKAPKDFSIEEIKELYNEFLDKFRTTESAFVQTFINSCWDKEQVDEYNKNL